MLSHFSHLLQQLSNVDTNVIKENGWLVAQGNTELIKTRRAQRPCASHSCQPAVHRLRLSRRRSRSLRSASPHPAAVPTQRRTLARQLALVPATRSVERGGAEKQQLLVEFQTR